jgi:FtsP/CotA-like multicopper oxidase with cupredoxin domain
VSQRITDDLEQGLLLTAFEPLQSLLQEQPDGAQTVSFRIGAVDGRLAFQIGSLDANGQPVDLASYDPLKINRTLQLGAVDEWKLKSFVAGHPFHIHVNPFQIVEILDRNGNDISGFEPGNNSPYARLKGVWKDTLFVAGPNASGPGPTLVLRTRYRRYIGDFVLHCHILDHEDQGMMQNVRIALPDGQGGIASDHH